MVTLFIFELIVFLFAVVIHEVSHGLAAERLGDPTARIMGRLTLNPIKHIDPIGSIALPLLMLIPVFFGGPPIIFGWAKPVPYNPANLKNPKVDVGLVAAAGPLANVGLAVVFAGLIRLLAIGTIAVAPEALQLMAVIVYVNILLAIFNLVPIPPLDGSKVLFSILPNNPAIHNFMLRLEQYGMIIIIVLLLSGGLNYIHPIIAWIVNGLIGGVTGL